MDQVMDGYNAITHLTIGIVTGAWRTELPI